MHNFPCTGDLDTTYGSEFIPSHTRRGLASSTDEYRGQPPGGPTADENISTAAVYPTVRSL